ncbi:MAG: hypothetical protein VCC20_13085, partial [Myxococcota bacterium]
MRRVLGTTSKVDFREPDRFDLGRYLSGLGVLMKGQHKFFLALAVVFVFVAGLGLGRLTAP